MLSPQEKERHSNARFPNAILPPHLHIRDPVRKCMRGEDHCNVAFGEESRSLQSSKNPRIFTKLMKPVYSTLRTRGHISSGYLDDSFFTG